MTGKLIKRNGIYHMRISYNDENGKWRSVTRSTKLAVKGNTRRAQTMLEDFIKEFQAKSVTPITSDSDYLFTDYLDMWVEHIKPNVAKATYSGYKNCIRVIKRYFEPMNLKLSELKPIHLQQFYNKRLADGVKAVTVIHYHANIHKALKYAVKMELLTNNPSDNVDLPKKEVFTGNFYSEDEVLKMFDAFKGDECELCVHIAAFYGLRRSEIIGLKWSAIDFENKTLTICNKVTEALNDKRKYELVIEGKLKNQSSRRTMPLIPHIEEMLLAEKERQEHFKKLCGKSYSKEYDGYVCRKSTGELIKPNYFSDHFKLMLNKNGLRRIRLHDLRHTCASLLLKNGVQMKQIQEWLGHSSFSTTANCYSHLDFASKIISAEIISKILK
ncbi:MAG: site-specific integrase [Ruminococcus sp.]|nr:site-specific integrase [Ruminococcus sp.]